MTDIVLRSNFDVNLVMSEGSDERICQAARVSTLGSESINSDESSGLINFLMANRHGSPFEHTFMTFLIRAPIFVWREFMRHRIGFSYNEQSGRYMELAPEFYVPSRDHLPKDNRPLIQVGKPGHYEFVAGTKEQIDFVRNQLEMTYKSAWNSYQLMLKGGIAKEVARMGLPLSIYSSAYVTCNARSMMSFLSLRTKYADSMFPSYPQWEINRVADQMEVIFAEKFPITHATFNKNGRVSP